MGNILRARKYLSMKKFAELSFTYKAWLLLDKSEALFRNSNYLSNQNYL